MDRKRVPRIGLMARNIAERGGIGVFTRQVVSYLLLNAGGIEYHVLLAEDSQRRHFDPGGARVIHLAAAEKLTWDQWAVPRYAEKEKLDLVFNFKLSVPLSGHFRRGFFFPGAEQFAMSPLFPLVDRAYTHLLMPRYAHAADLIVTCANQGKRDTIRHLHARPESVSVIPPGVHPWLRPGDAPEVEALRKKLDLPGRFVLFVGGITPLKNVGNLMRAMTHLPEQERIHLVLAGFHRWHYSVRPRLDSGLEIGGSSS
jgi:glycosyltransferase involved in cell wall biosynthesis